MFGICLVKGPLGCKISFWLGLQNGPPQVMSPGSENVGFPVSLQDFVGSVRVGQTNRKFTTLGSLTLIVYFVFKILFA